MREVRAATGERFVPRQSIEDRFYRTVVDALSSDRLVLPTLPEIAVRIAQMTRDPDVSIGKLAAEIGKDPGISVRLVRVANSASHGGARRLETLQQAVTRLGLRLTRLLVSGLAMEQMFFSDTLALGERLRRCWHDSVEVGALAQVLAARCTKLQPEMAMLAGLLHQVGVLPILKLAAQHPEALDSSEVLEDVIARLGPRVGRLVLQAWNFPPELIEVPDRCGDFGRKHDGAPDYVDVVTLAVLHHGRADPLLRAVDRSVVPAYAQLRLKPGTDLIEQLDAGGELDRQRSLLAA